SADLQGMEKIVLDSAYGEFYRQNFMLEVSPLASKLEKLTAFAAEKRFLDLKSWSKGSVRIMTAVLSLQSDVENGQLFLRSLYSGQMQKTPFYPGWGELSGSFWRMLWGFEGDREKIQEACRYDPSAVSDLLCESVSRLDERHSLWEAEWFFLDGVFQWARRLLEPVRGEDAALVERWLSLLTDLWNVRIWLHSQMNAVSQENMCYLDGGTLSENVLLSSKRLDVLLRGSFWEGKSLQNAQDGSLLSMERSFLRWQLALRRQNPLGVEVVISYMAQQFCEWRNMSAVLVGILCNLDSSLVRAVLLP
ncbi:MAG: V-type ATPase subunit, partial [Pyramidobacter sp.]|nr:V-type ATPase subunit [Pyramidobacter sp.]